MQTTKKIVAGALAVIIVGTGTYFLSRPLSYHPLAANLYGVGGTTSTGGSGASNTNPITFSPVSSSYNTGLSHGNTGESCGSWYNYGTNSNALVNYYETGASLPSSLSSTFTYSGSCAYYFPAASAGARCAYESYTFTSAGAFPVASCQNILLAHQSGTPVTVNGKDITKAFQTGHVSGSVSGGHVINKQSSIPGDGGTTDFDHPEEP